MAFSVSTRTQASVGSFRYTVTGTVSSTDWAEILGVPQDCVITAMTAIGSGSTIQPVLSRVSGSEVAPNLHTSWDTAEAVITMATPADPIVLTSTGGKLYIKVGGAASSEVVTFTLIIKPL